MKIMLLKLHKLYLKPSCQLIFNKLECFVENVLLPKRQFCYKGKFNEEKVHDFYKQIKSDKQQLLFSWKQS